MQTAGTTVAAPMTGTRMPWPAGTIVLCALTLGAAAAQSVWNASAIAEALGLRPEAWFVRPGTFILSLFTYVFPHGGWWHAIPNTIALAFFGALAERAWGARRLIAVYMLCGAVGALCKMLVPPHGDEPMTGASLALSGLLGAYYAGEWARQMHSRRKRLAVVILELSSVIAAFLWLPLRTVPPATNLSSSIAYHALPFVVVWLAVLRGKPVCIRFGQKCFPSS